MTTTQPLTPGTDETTHAGPFTIVSTPPTAHQAEYVEVVVHWEGTSFPSRVTITGPRHKYGADELSPAEVNWSAIGAVSPEDAQRYATAILLAAQIAPTLRPPTARIR